VRPLTVYPPLPPRVWLRRPRRPLPFPLDRPEHRLFLRARHGLREALGALGVEPGDELLMPAYHHGSEVETVVRSGMTCRFYDGTEPVAERLEELVGPRTRALYLIHYLGLPQDSRRWRGWTDDRGLLLVEDAAQSWLASSGGRPVGALADIAIFCLYKSFGVPDGGAVVAPRSLLPEAAGGPLGARTLLRRHADWLAQRTSRLAPAHADVVEVPERDFAIEDSPARPSAATRAALPRTVDVGAPARRRANYERLRERLASHLAPQLPPLTDDAAPLAFPVLTARKEELLGHLAAHGIVQGRMWGTPHPALPVREFPTAAALRAQLVGLPVHHELSARDVRRIGDVAAAYLGA
jgi:dTDP-4-amino-4,6-dideoxygalactose transaminase